LLGLIWRFPSSDDAVLGFALAIEPTYAVGVAMSPLRELENRESRIKNSGYAGWGVLAAIGTFILIVLFNFLILFIASAFEPNVGRKVPGVIPQCLTCCIPFLAALIVYVATPRLIKSISLQRVREEIAVEKNILETKAYLARLAEQAKERLYHLEASIKMLVQQLQISFPASHLTRHSAEIESFINTYGTQLLKNSAPLERFVVGLSRQAEQDITELEKTRDLNAAAISLYNDACHQAIRADSQTHIEVLNTIHKSLTDKELKALLTQRRWNDYYDVVNSIIANLKWVKESAINYQTPGEEEQYSEEPQDETEEERAYRILGASPTASNEQIKALYKKLAKIFHPDSGEITTDVGRFREIKEAYDIIRANRNMH
jgi:hypothetical protein